MNKDITGLIEEMLEEIESNKAQLVQDVTKWDDRFKTMPATMQVLAQHEAKKLLIPRLINLQERLQKILS